MHSEAKTFAGESVRNARNDAVTRAFLAWDKASSLMSRGKPRLYENVSEGTRPGGNNFIVLPDSRARASTAGILYGNIPKWEFHGQILAPAMGLSAGRKRDEDFETRAAIG